MIATLIGAITIMLMRICDVTIGTMRTILVVQGRKYIAAAAGFFEVLIWIFAIRNVMQQLDQTINLVFYALGFALGNIVGITIEQKIGFGFVQLNIISRHYSDKIADLLRKEKHGVTMLPGEGGSGGVSVIITIVSRKVQKHTIKLIESIDKDAFITVQQSLPYRGFVSSQRK